MSRDGRKTGGGSRLGRPNKITADIKAMILGALSEAGGQAYLVEQAVKNPVAFMGLLGKVLPMQVAGEDGSAVIVQLVQYGALPTADGTASEPG
jgi:hypothetical protein